MFGMLSRRIAFFAMKRTRTTAPGPKLERDLSPFMAYHRSVTLFQENALKSCPADSRSDLEWSMDKLNKTSRSFSAVIVQLPEELRHAVSMFYLTLQALDTIGKF
jgi:hypothetical protein